MDHASLRYKYAFVDGDVLSYLFDTNAGASYRVKFKSGPELVDDPAYEGLIFEMAILLIVNPYDPKLPPSDILLSATIAAIVADFFTTRERAMVYLYDDSDAKADARQKLFNRWFARFDKQTFVKKQVPVAIEQNGVQYTAEFVARADNPYLEPLLASFTRVVSGQK